jgi:hypothetical protein
MPGDFGDLAVNTRVHTYYQYAHTRLRVRLAPGIPHALFGTKDLNNSGVTRRENVKVCLPSLRGAKATKQSIFFCAVRWIASLTLAMTESQIANAQHFSSSSPAKASDPVF